MANPATQIPALKAPSPANVAVALLASALFDEIVGLEVVPASGQGVRGSDGMFVGYSTAISRCTPSTIVEEGVRDLALSVKEEGVRVGAVKIHVLTPCCVMALASGKLDVFWDGLYELPDGNMYSPMSHDVPAPEPRGVWHKDTHNMS